MTRLDVTLTVPGRDGSPQAIRCLGVVIRQDRIQDSPDSVSYLTAIYFHQIRPEDRRRIAEFVLASMLSHGHRSP